MTETNRTINKVEKNSTPLIAPITNHYPVITTLECDNNLLTANLSDGRTISVPTAWFPTLRKATKEQLKKFELAFDGEDITWPELDTDISSKVFITGLNGSCC